MRRGVPTQSKSIDKLLESGNLHPIKDAKGFGEVRQDLSRADRAALVLLFGEIQKNTVRVGRLVLADATRLKIF